MPRQHFPTQQPKQWYAWNKHDRYNGPISFAVNNESNIWFPETRSTESTKYITSQLSTWGAQTVYYQEFYWEDEHGERITLAREDLISAYSVLIRHFEEIDERSYVLYHSRLHPMMQYDDKMILSHAEELQLKLSELSVPRYRLALFMGLHLQRLYKMEQSGIVPSKWKSPTQSLNLAELESSADVVRLEVNESNSDAPFRVTQALKDGAAFLDNPEVGRLLEEARDVIFTLWARHKSPPPLDQLARATGEWREYESGTKYYTKYRYRLKGQQSGT